MYGLTQDMAAYARYITGADVIYYKDNYAILHVANIKSIYI